MTDSTSSEPSRSTQPDPDVAGEGAEPPTDAVRDALDQDVADYSRVLSAAFVAAGASKAEATSAVAAWVKLNAPKGDASKINLDRRLELFESIKDGRAYVKDGRVLFRAAGL